MAYQYAATRRVRLLHWLLEKTPTGALLLNREYAAGWNDSVQHHKRDMRGGAGNLLQFPVGEAERS